MTKPQCSAKDCRRCTPGRKLCDTQRARSRRGMSLEIPIRPVRPHGSSAVRDANGNKECTACLCWRTITFFGKDSYQRDGMSNRCRLCDAARRHKTTGPAVEAILSEQEWTCPICLGSLRDKWYIDHDHECCDSNYSCGNCIRGVVCGKCNSALGMMKDSMEIVQRAS